MVGKWGAYSHKACNQLYLNGRNQFLFPETLPRLRNLQAAPTRPAVPGALVSILLLSFRYRFNFEFKIFVRFVQLHYVVFQAYIAVAIFRSL